MKVIFTFLILLFFIQGFAQKPKNYDIELSEMYEMSVELIEPEVLYNHIDENSTYILDTREKSEFNVSHIPNALHVGYEKFSMNAVSEIPTDAQIIVYCSLGVRSERIGEQLIAAGYENVKNLYGGVFEWAYQDLPLVDKKGIKTTRVHAYDKDWSRWLLKGEKVF